MIGFKEIEFGYKSAEAERRNQPDLLTRGFFERNDIINDLIDGSEYLVLGYKGSGKSTISEHLSLMANDDPELFVETILLRDFPFEQIPQIVPGEIDVSVRTNLAWSILLLLKLFESLSRDEGVDPSHAGQVSELARDLQRLNLVPKRKFRDLVLASREIDLSFELTKAFSSSMKQTYAEPVVALSHVRDALRELICNASTKSRHMLVIDGLDEIFTFFSGTYETLASLVHEVDSLNADFDESDSCAKILLLCRTDLFERLPSPNINKLRDYSVVLDWYHNPQQPLDSDLFTLAQHRARAAGYLGENVIAENIPERLQRSFGGDVKTYRFLLDHTRHTPRDFLQILHHIQMEARGPRVRSQDVFDGLREYSLSYFLPEIKDELAGYFNPEEVDQCFRVIGGLRRREFLLSDLEEYALASGYAEGLDLKEAIRVLFDSSAVGNIVDRPRGRLKGIYYTFRFRNRNASVNYAERLILHRGVWKALNIA